MIEEELFNKYGEGWQEGPWQEEPDHVYWTDEASQLRCQVLRMPTGHLCGYVAVDKDHPLYKTPYSDMPDLSVHGGLTYSQPAKKWIGDRESREEAYRDIHEDGFDEDDWVFGFDCAHLGDLSTCNIFCPPEVDERLIEGLRSVGRGTYRDIEYVIGECERLAAQLRLVQLEMADDTLAIDED